MKKSIPQTVVLVFITVYMMIMSSEAKAGAADGLGLCENIIIPSLLPILILVNIGVKSKTADVLKKIFGKLFEKVLKLPDAVQRLLFSAQSAAIHPAQY